MFDLLIKNGTIVDGTGRAPYVGDVGIVGDVIVDIGQLSSEGKQVIDASERQVTPGFVDIHTHFDGQATWDSVLAPSSQHGITTVAMGNCGVGFAPARPDKHEWLIQLLEGVEDIPGTALAEGLTWQWESMPEYLDELDRRQRTLDMGVQIPHAALRCFVMGDRGGDHESVPTEDELATMAALVGQAIDAGYVGFTTSRTSSHKTSLGANIGTLTASDRELLALTAPLRDRQKGVIQLISDAYLSPDPEFVEAELGLIREMAVRTGRPLSFTVQQVAGVPGRWRDLIDRITLWRSQGLDIRGQISPRPIGVMMGLETSVQPFEECASYAEIGDLSLDARVAALRDPERKRRILTEYAALVAASTDGKLKNKLANLSNNFLHLFAMEDPVDYLVDSRESLASQARATGADLNELVYDTLLQRDGRQLLYYPVFNYAEQNLDFLPQMIASPGALFGLSDGGAHVGAISDASLTTSFLAMWAGPKSTTPFPIEYIIHMLTQRTAAHVGWYDRGVLAKGYKADLNVIDIDNLRVSPPYVEYDLPAGGRRLLQKAHGYDLTIKSGTVTVRDGEYTGENPGVLLRGGRPTPAASLAGVSA